MFDSIGFQEIILIGLVALLVIGPKDLPLLARKMGREMAKLRNMAGEFRASFDELARQAELDELRKEVEALKGLKPLREVQDALSEPVDLSISQALSTPEAFSKDAVVGLDSPPVEPIAEVPAIDIGVQKLMAAKAAAKSAQEASADAVAGAQKAPTRARRTAAKPIPEVAKPAPKKAAAPKKASNSAPKSASGSATNSGPKKSAAKESTKA